MNISSDSFQVRQLVFLVTVKHAERHPDLALLVVNSLQKQCKDSNALVRLLAIRVASSLNGFIGN
jgi:vesicle coat complex subunit